MPQRITEASTLTIESSTPGRVLLQLITPGWGSSGYYSAPVLENAATEQVWPKGTHVFFDHPSESERHDRPERSVRDLAMILYEDARRDPDTGGLVAEARVIGPYRDLVTDPVFMEAVGMSIRASADTTVGEAEGRKGTIVTHLVEGVSVDLVTRAGRGGRILAAVESARATMREATANDTRSALYVALKAAYGAEDAYTWVRDFDPEQGLVYFETEDADAMRTYQQSYAIADDGTATLTGSPVEVRASISYVPVVPDTTPDTVEGSPQPPVIPAGSTQESEEDTMPQIEESRLAQLEADAGRANTAESERDTAARERDEAREALARIERRDTIARVIESVEGHDTLNALERRGVAADALHAEGDLDEDALRTAVETAVAERAATQGAGRITGFGATHTTTDTDIVREAETAAAGIFGRTTKEA